MAVSWSETYKYIHLFTWTFKTDPDYDDIVQHCAERIWKYENRYDPEYGWKWFVLKHSQWGALDYIRSRSRRNKDSPVEDIDELASYLPVESDLLLLNLIHEYVDENPRILTDKNWTPRLAKYLRSKGVTNVNYAR